MSSTFFPSQLEAPKICTFNHFTYPHHHRSELLSSTLKPNAKHQKANYILVTECLLHY